MTLNYLTAIMKWEGSFQPKIVHCDHNNCCVIRSINNPRTIEGGNSVCVSGENRQGDLLLHNAKSNLW